MLGVWGAGIQPVLSLRVSQPAKRNQVRICIAACPRCHHSVLCAHLIPLLKIGRPAYHLFSDIVHRVRSRNVFFGAKSGNKPETEEDGKDYPKPSGPYSPWPAGVLQMSQTFSRTDPHYLEIKEREKWWRNGRFPKARSSQFSWHRACRLCSCCS
jgi:hypothetical protein